jgi:hypothetical protein
VLLLTPCLQGSRQTGRGVWNGKVGKNAHDYLWPVTITRVEPACWPPAGCHPVVGYTMLLMVMHCGDHSFTAEMSGPTLTVIAAAVLYHAAAVLCCTMPLIMTLW